MDVINMDKINELRLGLETEYIDGSVASMKSMADIIYFYY